MKHSKPTRDVEKPALTARPQVYLVGAGPGDPGLITVKGRDLLSQADVVVYDYLASAALLKFVPPDAQRIYVGKQAGKHTLSQEEINALLIEKAKPGCIVVRLKGGDPYVFGRGGEEALALAEAGIGFEVVPGITAGIAAPAYAGIPVTHRDWASDFALITGHEDAERTETTHVDWAALGKWQGTLAFYMGVKNLPLICERLREHGMASNTPAALIGWGTTPRQRTLVATVATLPASAAENHFEPPAIILIGKVISLRDQLNWFERRCLFGRRIIVTRSRSQASQLIEPLTQLGAEVLECPTIRIVPPADTEPVRTAIRQMPEYHWLIFTSVNGVESFFEILLNDGHDARHLGQVKVCAIGPATADKLRSFGIVADLVPPEFVAESIAQELGRVDNLLNKRLLLPRTDIARPDLCRLLQAMGAVIDEVIVYHTVTDEPPSEEVVQALRENRVDWITFTSSSTVRNFLKNIDLKIFSGKKTRLASIGPITSNTIREAGLEVAVEAEKYTIAGLIEAICRAEAQQGKEAGL